MQKPSRVRAVTGALFLAVSSLAVLTSGAARAEVTTGGGDVPPVSQAPMGKNAVRRGVQGPEGLFTARLHLLVNASKGTFGKPTSLAPDLYYSISDSLQVGLVHTGPMGWQTLPGGSLCLTGTPSCPKVYDNVGFDVMYGLLFGDFHLSVHWSLYLMPISDPTLLMWTVGFTGKFHFTDVVALFFDPQLGIILTNRDDYDERLYIPLELQFQTSQAVSLKILSGVSGAMSELGDTAQVPLGLGLVANVSPNIDLGVRFSFDNLRGDVPEGASATDRRSFGLLVNFRN